MSKRTNKVEPGKLQQQNVQNIRSPIKESEDSDLGLVITPLQSQFFVKIYSLRCELSLTPFLAFGFNAWCWERETRYLAEYDIWRNARERSSVVCVLH